MTIAISIIVILLLLLVALIGGFYVYIYYFRIQRPVPTLTGDAPLLGLDRGRGGPARQARGAPHLRPGRGRRLARQGYIHAQERFWQMEQARRTAYGTLAEIFGAAALDADRFSRIIGLRVAAEAEAAALDDATRQVTSCYAEGVNAHLEAHAGRVAAELSLLRGARFLDRHRHGGRAQGLRLGTVPQLGERVDPAAPGAGRGTHPLRSWSRTLASTPIVLEGMGSAEVTRMLHTAGLMLNQYEQLKQWLGVVGEGQGSNSWVVAPPAA
ncbi:MAG: penicillin acylase family protein [Caldilineaceae bacterium]